MLKSDITQDPGYFTLYVGKAPDVDVISALSSCGLPIIEAARDKWEALGDQVYAPGKWTIKQTLQHIIDTERIFAYRALRISRGDQTPMPGFEQDDYMANCNVGDRDLNEIIKELINVRQSTLFLYKSLSAKAMLAAGTASGMEMSPLMLGFLCVGHLIHHQEIIEERYYPLIEENSAS